MPDPDPSSDELAWIHELFARRPQAWAQAPRVQVHRHDHGSHREGPCWSATATSCDALGCEVEAPARVRIGAQVLVELHDERVGDTAAVVGHVHACTDGPPWRVTIRLDAAGMLTALRFF